MARIGALFAVICLSLLVTAMSAPNSCIEHQHSCIRNEECCEGCCSDGKCVKHADGCASGLNPCSVHSCPSGKTCYLQPVACVAAPCDPVPACRDPDYDY